MGLFSNLKKLFSRAKKPKIAVFDLSDCEGCELQFLFLKEKLIDFSQNFEIVEWRLLESDGKNIDDIPQIDVSFVQGTVITQNDINLVKKIRQKSKKVIAMGECARTGWIPSWIDKKARQKAIKKIYGPAYKPKAVDAAPLKKYIKVDKEVPGCPPNFKTLEKLLKELKNEK